MLDRKYLCPPIRIKVSVFATKILVKISLRDIKGKYEITQCFFASHDTFFWPCSSFLTFCGLVWPCLTSSDSLDLPWPYLTSSDLIWPPLTHLTSPDLDWPLLTFPDPLTSCDLINPGLAWPIAGSGLILFDLAWPHIWPCLTSPGFSFRHPNIFKILWPIWF